MWETKLNASRAVQTSDETTSSSSSSANRLPIHSSKESTAQSSSNSSAADTKPSIHHVDPTRAAIQAAIPQLYKPTSGGATGSANQDIKSRHLGAQIDGGVDGSSSEDDEDDDEIIGAEHGDDDDLNDDDDDDDDKTNNDDQSEHGKEDPEPLNSEDDLTNSPGSNNSNSDLFDTENVIVCQYDKITRIKNKWKFHLKDGVMNINGKDYLFSKANGDAEW
jgi:transcription initiation factor TFIIA large subunit